jgi:hypothetical protein
MECTYVGADDIGRRSCELHSIQLQRLPKENASETLQL